MKKKIFSLVIAVAMLFTMVPASAFAGTVRSDTRNGIKWSISDTGVLTIEPGKATEEYEAGEMGNFQYYEDYKAWKNDKDKITSIVIEDGVKDIGTYAFQDMYDVKSIEIPDSVDFIGENAFYNTGIESVVIPGSVETVDQKAFWCAYNLKSVTFEDGVESIGFLAFGDCYELAEINMPASVVNVGDRAFENTAYINAQAESGAEFSVLNHILVKGNKDYTYDVPCVIPEGIRVVAGGAFYDNEIYKLELPESLEYIGDSAFADMSYATKNKRFSSVDLKNVKHIGYRSFANCRSLRSIELSNVEYIGDDAFYWCDAMHTVTISGKLRYMGNSIFSVCDVLNIINLPESFPDLEYIHPRAFSGTYINDEIYANRTDDGICYFKDVLLTFYQVDGYDYGTELTVKDGTILIADDAFGYTDPGYTSIVIPESVKYIGDISVLYNVKDIYYAGDKAGWDAIVKDTAKSESESYYYPERFYAGITVHCAKSSAENLNPDNVSIAYTSKAYTGNPLKPSVTVKNAAGEVLKANTDYKLTYTDNTNAGTATVTVTGINKYEGTVEKTFEITRLGVDSVTAKLSAKKYTYDGEEHTPDVIATDKHGNTLQEGRDFICVYSEDNRANPGVYGVTIELMGNYTGLMASEYHIVPGVTSTLKIELSTATGGYDDVVVRWDVVPVASGYHVYIKKATAKNWGTPADCKRKDIGNSYTKKNLMGGVKYDVKVVAYYKDPETGQKYEANTFKKGSITTLKKVQGIAVAKVNASKIKVSWQKINGAAGYEVVRMTAKNKKYTIQQKWNVGAAKNTLTITPKKGTKFHYKVRAYQNVKVNNRTVKVYGPWSIVKPYNLKK